MKTLYLPLKKQWYEMIEREAENKRRYLTIAGYYLCRGGLTIFANL